MKWMYDERIKTLFIHGTGFMPAFELDDEDEDADIPWLDLDFERAVIGEGITRVGVNSFLNCKNLRVAELPDSVTVIDDFAFEGCVSLEHVRVPHGLKCIGNSSFYGCKSLRTIDLPDGLERVCDFAFDGCSSLESVWIPDSVMVIGDMAFNGCGSLTAVMDNMPGRKVYGNAFDDDAKIVGWSGNRWRRI